MKDNEIAESACKRLLAMGAQASARTPQGEAAFQIMDIRRTQGIDLVAMATHGGSEGFYRPIGSVTRKVLQAVQVPMLPVPVEPVDSSGNITRKGWKSHLRSNTVLGESIA